MKKKVLTSKSTAIRRYNSVDIARGLALLFMVIVHCSDVYSDFGLSTSFHGDFSRWVGSHFTAPLFLMLMGYFTFFNMSRMSLFKRGVFLILLGYCCNLVRAALPLMIMEALDGDIYSPFTVTELFVFFDILHLAGVALLINGAFLFLLRNKIGNISYILAVSFFAPELWNSEWQHFSLVSKYLFGANEWVAFPVFPNAVYVNIGILIAQIYGDFTRVSAGAQKALFWVGPTFYLLGSQFHLTDNYPELTFYTTIDETLRFIGASFLLLSFCLVAEKKSWLPGLAHILTFWGRNVTSFWFLSWVIIIWSTAIFGYHSISNPISSIGIVSYVLWLTHLSTLGLGKLRKSIESLVTVKS